MAWRHVTDGQWVRITAALPSPKAKPKGGRPPLAERQCFEGLLWVLWTGAPWSELPRRYGAKSAVHRRLSQWARDGTLLAPTVESIPERCGQPERLIADRGYDSTAARAWLAARGIEPIIPARSNNPVATHQDGRKLRRYTRRWLIERSIAWLQNFRRLVVRDEYLAVNFIALVHLACVVITLKRVEGWLVGNPPEVIHPPLVSQQWGSDPLIGYHRVVRASMSIVPHHRLHRARHVIVPRAL